MRIRKRTPARAASPGPTRHRAESPPAPQQLKQERPHEEEEEEEKASLFVRVGEEENLVPAASKSKSRAMGVQKPDPEAGTQGASTAALTMRCSRNDGKRWRCKSEAVPGHLYCDRHIAWSARKRNPRVSKKNRSGIVLEEERTKEEDNEEYEAVTKASILPRDGGGDGFFNCYGGFQPGSQKRARYGGGGPAA